MTNDLEIELSDEGKLKKIRSKSITREELDAMFKRHDEEMAKKIDSMCDTCSHHECECPAKIEHMGKATEAKMDQLDENDELLRQGINDLAHKTDDDINELKGQLEQEHRLREATESELRTVKEESEKLKEESERLSKDLDEANDKVSQYKHAVDRNSSDVLKLGAITGAVLGVGLVVLALAIAGVL